MAEPVERGLRSLQQNEKIISTKSFCKFISCGGTCGRPECKEKERNFDFVRIPSGKFYRTVDNELFEFVEVVCEDSSTSSQKVNNGFGATTGIPHLPAPAETVSKSKTDSEAEPVDLIYFQPKEMIDISSDSEESSGSKTGLPHLPAPAEPVSKSKTDSEAEPFDLISFKPKEIINISSDSDESSGSNVITSDDSNLQRIMKMSKDNRRPHSAWKTLRINADWPTASPSWWTGGEESSGSNVITSDDSNLQRIMEMSKDSRSPHRAWKTLRINADWPIASPSWRTRTRQIGRYVRLVKKRRL